jgi:hypothetical protein
MPIQKYGITSEDELFIEFHMLRQSDEFLKSKGTTRLYHYLQAHKFLWPEDDQHRWFLLGMKSIVENKVSVFLGCASSGKSYLMAAHALITFWAFPHTSLGLVSSTDSRSLDHKIWGRGIKTLFNRAKRRYGWLQGYVLESSRAITADEVDDEGEFGRLLNTGIACVPCVSGGRFIGMGKYQGIKPPDSPGKNDGLLTHYGDESAVMHTAYLDAYTNWMVNKNFKGVQSGNPTDISDPLCTAAEPVGGWDTFEDTGKTQEWTSKWYGAHVVAFDGRDTPNNDQPGIKYPFLVSLEFVESLRATHGDDSWQFFQQGVGKPSKGMVSNRVITMGFCERHKAFEPVVWRSTPMLKIGALDPAYGGGDRCVFLPANIGPDVNEQQIMEVGNFEIVPIRLNQQLDAEEQIAGFMKTKSDRAGIPPENMFYDSFGRGTLGFPLAKVFGSNCPVPVNSGESASGRPVRFDLFVKENNGTKRLKRCNEEYSKFITELWFSVREMIHSEQMRNLHKDIAQEGQLRLYRTVTGARIEVEPKDEMKERVKRSPDLFDTLAILVEGARQRGFRITRIGLEVQEEPSRLGWFLDLQKKSAEKRLRHSLHFYE